MATITTINATDLLSASRAVINTNFSNLNTAKVDGATALTTAGRLVEVASSGVATQTSFASSVVVLTSGSYADPAWVTSLATTKLTGTLQAAQFPALTGDITTSTGAVATTLANTAVTPASYGSATQVATFTVDSKGRLTAAASTSIAIAASQVTSGTLDNARTTAASTNTVSAIVARDASGNFAAGTITATFTGNLTGNVTGNVSGTAATITGALALSNTPLTTRGDLLVATTATPILGRLAKGTQYQVLTGGATDPTWGAVDLSQGTAITGTLPVGNGGTGATTLAGAGIVVGSASLTTANAVPVVASAGTLGQSDVSLASGVFSRAGTVGLSATGANVVTFSTNGVERGRFTSAGYFGVGTNAPSTLMHLVGDEQLTLQRSSANAFGFALDFLKSRGTAGSPADVSDGDTISWIRSAPYSGSYKYLNSMIVAVDGTFTSTQNPPTRITFYTNEANGSATERIRIKNNGNVLIGTTTDDTVSKLQVAGKAAISSRSDVDHLLLSNVYNVSDDLYVKQFFSNDNQGYGWRLAAKVAGGGEQFLLQEYSGSTNTTRLTIASGGNIGIGGTAALIYRLDVQSSGSTGTMRVYDQTAVTGVSTLVVRAGAGQSTTALTTWQNNAGSNVASIGSDGTLNSTWLRTTTSGTNKTVLTMTSAGSNYGTLQTESTGGAGEWALGFQATPSTTVGTKVISWTGDSKIGFFGVTPVARAAALTAADASALNTGDAGSDAVIGNIRTRLGELETKLQAYGLLN